LAVGVLSAKRQCKRVECNRIHKVHCLFRGGCGEGAVLIGNHVGKYKGNVFDADIPRARNSGQVRGPNKLPSRRTAPLIIGPQRRHGLEAVSAFAASSEESGEVRG